MRPRYSVAVSMAGYEHYPMLTVFLTKRDAMDEFLDQTADLIDNSSVKWFSISLIEFIITRDGFLNETVIEHITFN